MINIPFDLGAAVADEDAETVGVILSLLAFGAGKSGRDMEVLPSWNRLDELTPRPIAVAMLGDEIYEDGMADAIRRYRHEEAGVDLFIVSACGHVEIAFRACGAVLVGEAGRGRWRFDDLEDPRNDPAHDPWAPAPDGRTFV